MRALRGSAELAEVRRSGEKAAMLLTAQWAGETCEGMRELLRELEHEHHRSISFYEADADEVSDSVHPLGCSAVPFLALFNESGELVSSVQGAAARSVSDAILKHASGSLCSSRSLSSESTHWKQPPPSVDQRIDALLQSGGVLLFMKGKPSNPRCGFSRRVVEVLARCNVREYKSFDILQDEGVRQRLKERAEWSLFPQLYANGELLGGCDIVEELERTNSLRNELGLGDDVQDGDDPGMERVKTAIEQSKHDGSILVFMKGSPGAERCGFSKRTVQAIQSAGDFKLHHVDVLHDDGVRDAVKRYNDWPTVPQVFAGGEFVGGCDIIEQMHSSGQLGQALRVEMGESANGMSTEAA